MESQPPIPRTLYEEVTLSPSTQRHLDGILSRKPKPTPPAFYEKSETETKTEDATASGTPEATSNAEDREFTLFPNLPIELRIKILRQYYQDNREDRIVQLKSDFDSNFSCNSSASPNLNLMQVSKEGRGEALGVLGLKEIELFVPRAIPEIFSKEERQSKCVLDPKNDILNLRHSNRNANQKTYLAELSRLLTQKDIIKQVRCVAIDFDLYIDTPPIDDIYQRRVHRIGEWHEEVIKFLAEFSSLELLLVVFQDNYFHPSKPHRDYAGFQFGSLRNDPVAGLYHNYFGLCSIQERDAEERSKNWQKMMARGEDKRVPRIELVRKVWKGGASRK